MEGCLCPQVACASRGSMAHQGLSRRPAATFVLFPTAARARFVATDLAALTPHGCRLAIPIADRRRAAVFDVAGPAGGHFRGRFLEFPTLNFKQVPGDLGFDQ